MLLGKYLSIPPAFLKLRYTNTGKPVLDMMNKTMYFSTSHSGRMAAYSFATHCEVGIDIEQIRDVPDVQAIASRFFSPQEAADLWTLDAVDRMRAFFTCWTRKEAYTKATGEGFSETPNSFTVTLRPDERAAFKSIGHDPLEASRWSLYDLPCAPEYVGAVAFRGAQKVRVAGLQTAEDVLSQFVGLAS